MTKAMIATCRKGIGDLLYIPGTVIIPGTRVPMLHVQCTTRILQYGTKTLKIYFKFSLELPTALSQLVTPVGLHVISKGIMEKQ